MEIDFVVDANEPDLKVIRDALGGILKIEVDFRLTLIEIHCLSRKLLSADEWARYAELMMPKPSCIHVGADYRPTRGYVRELEPQKC